MDYIITDIDLETGEENPQFIYSDNNDDEWIRPLSSNEEIKMILSRLIDESCVCNKIIKYKMEIEEKESRDYHLRMWNLIAGAYFKGIDKSSKNIKHDMSYVLNLATKNTEYKVKIDLDLEYFQYTNTSYQVKWFLLGMIKELKENDNFSNRISFKERKEWLYFDDKYYGTLMSLLMNDMRRHCVQGI